MGRNSVLLLDEPEHARQRKLMLPSFHGERMQRYGEQMHEITDREIDSWAIGTPFPSHAHTGDHARGDHADRLRGPRSGTARAAP